MSISKQKVQFPSEGLTLTGDLFLPEGFDENKKYDGVLITGSWITVKEQMAGLYAQKLAQQGFVALRNWLGVWRCNFLKNAVKWVGSSNNNRKAISFTDRSVVLNNDFAMVII